MEAEEAAAGLPYAERKKEVEAQEGRSWEVGRERLKSQPAKERKGRRIELQRHCL